MAITINWTKALEFSATSEQGYSFQIDGNSAVAPCPTEVLLSALGSCSATDVVLGLQDQGADLFSLSNEISYTLTDDEPRLYKSVNLHFQVSASNITEIQLGHIAEQAISKYCHVCLMMQPTIAISYTVALGE